jgi:hypothetical protein
MHHSYGETVRSEARSWFIVGGSDTEVNRNKLLPEHKKHYSIMDFLCYYTYHISIGDFNG